MPNWLTDLVNQHVELESPVSFWKWSAIAAISATVKDNIWMNRQIYNLYPNIYVMLHAESGLKKGPPISMAKKLVQKVNNTHIISGRSSIQGILKDLGTSKTEPGGKVINYSTAFICSSELSSSIVNDPVATTILTDLYDRQYNEGEWKSLLKMESFKLKSPTITMLTATNEAMAEDFFTRSAIQGGYYARTFIIYEKEGVTDNSLIYPLINPPNYNLSGEYLRELSKLSGVFKSFANFEKDDEYRFSRRIRDREIWFNETGIIYEDWYKEFKLELKDQEVKDDTGTLNRFGDSVLKVAMLIALAEKPILEISPEAMDIAISECKKLVGNARRTTLGKTGTSNTAMLKSMILIELITRENHQITQRMLMKKLWMHYSNESEFVDIMNSFNTSGAITTAAIGNQIMYQMPEDEVKKYKKLMGKS